MSPLRRTTWWVAMMALLSLGWTANVFAACGQNATDHSQDDPSYGSLRATIVELQGQLKRQQQQIDELTTKLEQRLKFLDSPHERADDEDASPSDRGAQRDKPDAPL